MTISTEDWNNYIKKLAKLSTTAAQMMRLWVEKNGLEDIGALIEYAYAVITKYGEGSAELACLMYDAIADVQNAAVLAAVPAKTATMHEVAKAINGTLKQSPSGQLIPSVTSRLVKQAGADTTLQNAKRDKAWFAWVPTGIENCTYCIMLAGIGWQKASNTTLDGTHAEHIHANCDCQYVIDFKGDLVVEGYDPEEYDRQIQDALGEEWDAKGLALSLWDKHKGKENYNALNEMRRFEYQKNKDAINAQKREAYAIRKENNEE